MPALDVHRRGLLAGILALVLFASFALAITAGGAGSATTPAATGAAATAAAGQDADGGTDRFDGAQVRVLGDRDGGRFGGGRGDGGFGFR